MNVTFRLFCVVVAIVLFVLGIVFALNNSTDPKVLWALLFGGLAAVAFGHV